MLKIVKSAWIVVLGVGLASACGGDDDEDAASSTTVDTGLPESTPLSELSDADFEQGCGRLKTTVQTRLSPDILAPHVCAAIIGGFTDTADACQPLADGCVDDINSGMGMLTREMLDVGGRIDCAQNARELEGCSVTVGEFERCVNDTMDAFEAIFEPFTCENVAEIDADAAPALVGMDVSPPSCAELQAQCPDFNLIADAP